MKMNNIDRREALKKTALLLGGTISAPTILGVLNGCTPKKQLGWEPSFFSEEQAKLISSLTDTIIPAGETLGANDLGLPEFIDQIVGTAYTEKQQKSFIDGLNEFVGRCKSEMGDDFEELESEKKKEIIVAVHSESKDVEDEMEDVEDGLPPDERTIIFMNALRELTITGYCLSEYGATQILKYEKVPGGYKGCIPTEEVGGVWATS